MKLILLFTTLCISLWTKGEYRAFLLKIESVKKANEEKPNDPAKEKSEESTEPLFIKSNLDPEQYRSYYNVSKEQQISYTETWMCKGRTGGFKTICKSPKEIAAELEAEKQAEKENKEQDKSAERSPASNK